MGDVTADDGLIVCLNYVLIMFFIGRYRSVNNGTNSGTQSVSGGMAHVS